MSITLSLIRAGYKNKLITIQRNTAPATPISYRTPDKQPTTIFMPSGLHFCIGEYKIIPADVAGTIDQNLLRYEKSLSTNELTAVIYDSILQSPKETQQYIECYLKHSLQSYKEASNVQDEENTIPFDYSYFSL